MTPSDGESRPYDLAVIGGGINGCGIARDAAGRGVSVVLFERGDLAQGTSSASTKLIHGGLRYLEHYEFALVRESLIERERLWRIAPHVIRPRRFVLPHRPGLRPRWLLRLGLLLYDHLGGRERLPPARTLDLTRDPAGVPLQPHYRHAFEYSDCSVDDARLVVLNARDAADRGAVIHTRSEVTGLERADGRWRLTARRGDERLTVTARAVVNAAGPGAGALLGRADIATKHPLRLVRGSHIVVPRLFAHDRAYFFQLGDDRIFFAIPYEEDFTLIGTTDRDHDGSLDQVEASPEEVAYLCAGVNDYFRKPITPADVVWSFAGVRLLVGDSKGRPEAATRGYTLAIDAGAKDAPLLSVLGGKITTYRHLGEAALERLTPWLPALKAPRWTGDAPLPGGDFPVDAADGLAAQLAARYSFLDARSAGRLARSYGTIAFDWLGGAKQAADLGRDFGHGLSESEVAYLVSREWAVTAQDILWRRTKLGLRFSTAESAALARYLEASGAGGI